jgi:hypothetical protein
MDKCNNYNRFKSLDPIEAVPQEGIRLYGQIYGQDMILTKTARRINLK